MQPSTAQQELGIKPPTATPADKLKDLLERDYVSLAEATELVQERFPEHDFSRKQLERAVTDGNISHQLVGRLRYVPLQELEWYMERLIPTRSNPRKLRLRPRTTLTNKGE